VVACAAQAALCVQFDFEAAFARAASFRFGLAIAGGVGKLRIFPLHA